jgi:hypothetical protein
MQGSIIKLKTRRDFLQCFSRTAAATALSRESLLWSQPIETLRPVRAWVTSGTQRFAGFEAPRWQRAETSASLDIRIDPACQRQTVLDSCRFIRKQEYFNNFKRLGAIE